MLPAYATLLKASDLLAGTDNRFGDTLEKMMKAEDVAFTANGRNAIYLALKEMGLRRGDEVIVPGYTCNVVPDSVRAVCRPVFADIDPRTFNISPAEAERRITKRTKAMVVVHSYGNPCDMNNLMELAEKNNLVLIEDCAQSLLGTYKGRPLGSFGDYTILSFRFSKDITCFTGGALLSKERIKGRPSQKPAIDVTRLKLAGVKAGEFLLGCMPGFTHHAVVRMMSDEAFRESRCMLTGYQLSLLERQFRRLPRAIEKRRENVKLYKKGFKDVPDGVSLQKENENGTHTYYRFTVRHSKADQLQRLLWVKGIQADRMYNYAPSIEAESSRLAKEAINLPVHHNLKRNEIEYIMEAVHGILGSP